MNRYGLIGFPLSHSFSQHFFTNKFREEGITDCVYENHPLENIQEIQELIAGNPELRGLNVTIPYKEKVLPYLSHSNHVVKAVGACNCIKIEEGRLTGYNTDAPGFQRSFTQYLQSHHTKALILGEGGAAKAVAYALENLGIEYLYVVRRGKSGDGKILFEDLSQSILLSHKVVINSTPLGMHPNVHECPSINYNALTREHYLYDLIYNPEKTLFLQKGEEKGAIIKNGYEMLVFQAEESWKIWNEDADV